MIREMYAEIQKQTDKHSVSELCEIYGVSRSGYYKWLKRAGQLNWYEKTHKILDSYVLDIHSHHPMMGYRQIRDKLYLEFGWIVSDPTVWKSMKRLRIHGYTRRRKATATGTNLEHIRYANVLNRKFKAEKPMQKIVTDVTYIKHNGKWYYLAGYRLLGGAYREKIPAYVSGLPVPGLEEKVRLALEWKEKGFSAIKLQIGYGMEEDIRIMMALRKALGPDVKLMIDAHWNYTVPQAIKLARRLEPLGVEFLECPLNPEDTDGYAELAAAVDLPIALGEADRTHWQYKEILTKRSCDILQPDVGRCGITELMRIAQMAEVFGRPVAPHLSVGQGACIAATLHCDAALYNFYGMQEYQPSILPVANEFLAEPIICENGFLRVPDKPGLGLVFDEDKLRKYSDNTR